MPKLRIAPQWLGESLWVVSGRKEAEAVDIDDLGLSDELADRIDAWIDAFDAVYDEEQPEQSGFSDRETERLWRAEGEAIATALRAELGAGWEVELSL